MSEITKEMAEEDTTPVQVQLLADGIRLDGVDYVRGDTVTLPKAHADRLARWDSVAPVGTLEKRAKAERDRAKAEADYQRAVAE